MTLLIPELYTVSEAPQVSSKWRDYDYLVAVGDTIEELIKDATVYYIDQDGGDAGEDFVEDLPDNVFSVFSELIAEQYGKKINAVKEPA